MQLKKVGFQLPPADADAWNDFVDTQGLVKWKAVAGALRLFQLLPADSREVVMRGDLDEIRRLAGLTTPAGGVGISPASLEALSQGFCEEGGEQGRKKKRA